MDPRRIEMAVTWDLLADVSDMERRFAERTARREITVRNLQRGDYVEANGLERVEMRLQRLGASAEMADQLAVHRRPVSSAVESVDSQLAVGLERVLGTNDLISVNFLLRGLQVAQAVHRVRLGAAVHQPAGFGTGFLVSSRLMLTNHHVLPTPAEAANALVQFDYQEAGDGSLGTSTEFGLDPDGFFLTDSHLDYTLVAVESHATDGTPLERFGWIKLIETLGKAMIGELVNIIQHPGGEPKQLALRENKIIDVLDDFLHYQTDTAPGSSGSPVLNDQWELVALHHSGVPNRNSKGEPLTQDGRVWRPVLGEHRIHWIANEGARCSRIVASIKRQQLASATERRFRDGLFNEEPPRSRWGLEAMCVPTTASLGLVERPQPTADEIPYWGQLPEG
jgi:V8-like Glu-specific endopeptidase